MKVAFVVAALKDAGGLTLVGDGVFKRERPCCFYLAPSVSVAQKYRSMGLASHIIRQAMKTDLRISKVEVLLQRGEHPFIIP